MHGDTSAACVAYTVGVSDGVVVICVVRSVEPLGRHVLCFHVDLVVVVVVGRACVVIDDTECSDVRSGADKVIGEEHVLTSVMPSGTSGDYFDRVLMSDVVHYVT